MMLIKLTINLICNITVLNKNNCCSNLNLGLFPVRYPNRRTVYRNEKCIKKIYIEILIIKHQNLF